MEAALASRRHANTQVKPLSETQQTSTFLPRMVPVHAATAMLASETAP